MHDAECALVVLGRPRVVREDHRGEGGAALLRHAVVGGRVVLIGHAIVGGRLVFVRHAVLRGRLVLIGHTVLGGLDRADLTAGSDRHDRPWFDRDLVVEHHGVGVLSGRDRHVVRAGRAGEVVTDVTEGHVREDRVVLDQHVDRRRVRRSVHDSEIARLLWVRSSCFILSVVVGLVLVSVVGHPFAVSRVPVGHLAVCPVPVGRVVVGVLVDGRDAAEGDDAADQCNREQYDDQPCVWYL